jgi:uncharacterized protein (DUF488 family)
MEMTRAWLVPIGILCFGIQNWSISNNGVCKVMVIYTIGMQGLGIEDFVNELSSAKVGVVLDVRRNVNSGNRSGFSRLILHKQLTQAGISYLHFPKAGNPDTFHNCLSNYEKYLQENRSILWDLLAYIQRASEHEQTVCFCCNAQNASECHRSALVDALSKIQPELCAIHLPATTNFPKVSSLEISPRASV